MHHARTISIGGLTFDLFVFSAQETVKEPDGTFSLRLPLGRKIRVDKVVGTAGGGAANTSVGLSRLGCQASCSAVTGSDQWGQQLQETLQKEGVDTRSITVVEHEPSSFSIILLSPTGERVILSAPGTNEHLHDVTFDREAAATHDWVYLNHIQRASCVIQDDILAMLTASHPPHLTWNPGGCQIEEGMSANNNKALLAQTELLLVNKEEALAFTGAKDTDGALRTLREAGCRVVCITDGPRGAVAVDASHHHFCPSPDAPVIDTTGAGDAFGTGMTWALMQGMDLPTAMRAGTINAVSVLGAIGAQAGLLTHTEMQSRLGNTDIQVTSTPF